MNAPLRAYIGIGANLGDPVAQILDAIQALDTQLPDTAVVARSSLYGNPPWGPVAQPDYVNAVAEVETRLSPRMLLQGLQQIERAAGRTRDGVRWGPRLLDLDIVLYGDQIIDEADLQVPHPGLVERDFVWFPLLQLNPDLEIPGLGRLQWLSDRHSASRLRMIEERITA